MRPSREVTFLEMAAVLARRGTCPRRQVGCILTNLRHHIIGSGYNGVAAGLSHCTSSPCPGADMPSGTGLDMCEALHAEANALLQCRNVHEIDTAYVTVSPCVHCTKLLLNTSCLRIVFADEYSHNEAARQLWQKAGRKWLNVKTLT